jgi:hypothetical protein
MLKELRCVWPPLACGGLSCGRCTTQSLLEELLRVWPLLAAFVWQGQYTEAPGRAAARVVAAGPRRAVVWHAQYTKPPGKAAARVVGTYIIFNLYLATHHFSPPIFHITLSDTIFHTSFLTPFFTHHFVRHHLSHTIFHLILLHTIFDLPSFSYHFVIHHL